MKFVVNVVQDLVPMAAIFTHITLLLKQNFVWLKFGFYFDFSMIVLLEFFATYTASNSSE